MSGERIGELLVKNNLVSEYQVAVALEEKLNYPEKTLGQLLCEMGFIKKSELDSILDHHRKRQKLGEILLKRHILDEAKLHHALIVSRNEKSLLGHTLLKLNYVEEQQLAQCIADQYDLPFVSLKQLKLGPVLASYINSSYAIRHKIVAIGRENDTVTFAMAFPLGNQLQGEIERLSNIKIKSVIATESEIIQAQRTVYPKLGVAGPAGRNGLQIELSDVAVKEQDILKEIEAANNPETERLLQKIVATGLRARASDIHFERAENGLGVRYRIDGMMQPLDLGSDKDRINSYALGIISKLKVMCQMHIAERRRSQDSSFRMRVNAGETFRMIDFRVSTLLTQDGEDVVIRVLDKDGVPPSLSGLGLTRHHVDVLNEALDIPAGMFLVTGPTGSGKSATLHALLAKCNKPGLKSLTIEDPVEYHLEGVRQTEVNEAIGNTFSRMLKTFMRQDPDNIMIGELRDEESTRLAIKAALTGHTLMSSLQTRDSTSSVSSLLDMGIEPSYIASTLRCVIAQRLVRVVCKQCRVPHQPNEKTLKKFIIPPPPDAMLFISGKGCPACNFTGFFGRRPIAEVWVPTADDLQYLYQRPDSFTLRQYAFTEKLLPTMLDNGIAKVRRGETTLEEVLRVVPYTQLAEFNRRLELNLFSWERC